MMYISRSSRSVSRAVTGHFTLVCMGAVALIAGLGCTNAQIQGGAGGDSASQKGGGGNAGTHGGAGGGTSYTIPKVPDAGPDLPGGGLCGDGIRERSEQCDDGNTESGDGCSRSCQVEANWECPEENKPCNNLAVCGNGILTSDETCDDGNKDDKDGCSRDCQAIESGYVCPVPGKRCIPLCGDKVITGSETCDDGNSNDGDGCSSTCQLEPGYACPNLGEKCVQSECGNGKLEKGEQCDCGTDPAKVPSDRCKAVNGLFYGDGKGCSKTCTKEPSCLDSSGKTQACTATCGDGNLDPGEDCDDGDLQDGDGCSSKCKIEDGFKCENQTAQDSSPCQSGSGDCLELPVIYRDFQPENAASGGHPDFPFLGTKFGGSKSTTLCVPNAGGLAKGNDSTARCVGIMASTLLNGKPQPGTTTKCDCQFSDWNMGNSSRIQGNYTLAGNDSPLSNGSGDIQGGTAGTAVSSTSTGGAYTGTLTGYTKSTPGGPIWKGTVPAYKDAASFKQWFNDDDKVNKTFTAVLELPSIGTNIYQYASKSHLAEGGFFPLDKLNPSQATLCNLWPYWNHGNGNPIWTTCTGDQYLFPPRVTASDCPSGATLTDGCWVTAVQGVKHDSYFTDEARYYFVYDGDTGINLSFYGDDDLFIFINGVLVLDIGGVHQQLPGKVTVTGSPGDATFTAGGCLDSAGNQTGATAGSVACQVTNNGKKSPAAATPDDFKTGQVKLGLTTGKIYEIAIFGADRHPPESNYQLTLNGFTTKKSACTPRCGDGIATNGEQCDCGDSSDNLPDGCTTKNDDSTYGGCSTKCKYGPFCGDGITNGPEQCDLGKKNGDTSLGKDGCTIGCMKVHFCGDGSVDTDLGEECDLKELNDKTLDNNNVETPPPVGFVHCDSRCTIPPGTVF